MKVKKKKKTSALLFYIGNVAYPSAENTEKGERKNSHKGKLNENKRPKDLKNRTTIVHKPVF